MVAILWEHNNSGGAEDHRMTAKCLAKELRELSYDVEDTVDQYVHAAAARTGMLSPRRKKYKISRRRSKATSVLHLHEKLKWRLWMANKIRELSMRSQEALQRYSLFNHPGDNGVSAAAIGDTGSSTSRADVSFGSWRPMLYEEPIGIDSPMEKLEGLLGKDGEQKLKVVTVLGSGGIGKTTLAKELYRRIGGQFECRAFVRTSRKPDVRRLLISMLSQILPHKPPHNWKVHSLIAHIRTHLQDKRYLVVLDDVWATETWDIINRAFPDGNLCSGVLISTEVDDVALKCCGYDSKYVLMMKPLGHDDSSKLFFRTAFGPQYECPPVLSEVANSIIRKCAGLPLAMVTVASLLVNHMGKPEQWDYVNKSLGYDLRINPNSEGTKQIVNLSYNNLPQHLKACVMYLSIYEEDYIIQKDDLVKQWVAEGFIRSTEGKDMVEISSICFDELISSRMIQPVHINDNGDVLSGTVHRVVLDFIKHRSLEENFVTAIDHCQTTVWLADKVRRLSLQFGNAEATKPTNMRLSQVRTLAFFGVIKCLPSILEFQLLQVLILHLWGDDESISVDLTGISELFRLRYLHVTCNSTLELPQTQMRGLQHLETLKMDARVTVPSGIVHLPSLLHLSFPVGTNLPNGIDHMTTLCTLEYFDVSVNSMENVHRLGDLTNLRDLQLTCSTVSYSCLKSKMDNMCSILAKLSNLRSVTLKPSGSLESGPSSMSISCDGLSSVSSPPALLQRFEWLPHICTFSSIPKWIGHLNKLCILNIGVKELTSNDVDVLRGLPALTVLSLYVRANPAEKIVFTKTGFSVLKCFKLRCSVPWLEFEVNAMPNLLKLKLGFDAHGVDQHLIIPVGIVHLTCLKEISAKIGGAGANHPDTRAAESALIDAIKMHPARPTFNIHITLQKQCEIMEKDSTEQHGVLEKGSREDGQCRFSTPWDWKNVEATEPNRDQAAIVSDSELVERLREGLQESDLTTTTAGALHHRLEEGSDKKTFVREQTLVPPSKWTLVSNFKVAYNMLRRPDGTFDRELAEYMDRRVPANPKPVDGVSSLDHVIDHSVGLEARIYRAVVGNGAGAVPILEFLGWAPSRDPLPVIIFFHGGSFAHSASSTTIYDDLCRQLVKLSKGVVVSVNYRRAPEHRYPCAYHDGWTAFKWAQAQPFLQSGEDAQLRVFLSGDNSGGNIAHHVAVRAAEEGIKIHGNILLNAMFGGKERTESEWRLDGKYFVTIQDRDWYWKAYLPEDADRDHPACNPFGPNGRRLKGLPFTKSLVIVSGLDLTCDRQLGYADGLQEDGHDVKVVYREKATIGFYFLSNSDHYHEVMEEIADFLQFNLL